MTHLPVAVDESNDSNTISQAWQGQELTRFKQLAVDNAYRKLKNVMHMKKKNLFNPLKFVASGTRWAIHYLFKVIFGIVGRVLAVIALPLGPEKFKAVFGTFEMVGSLLEALIVTIIDFIIRMLLSPHWWYTAITVAREHSTKNNVPFKQGLSMVTAKAFVVIIERALRENFDDDVEWQPLSEDHEKRMRATTSMTILNSPSRFSLTDLENEQLLEVEQKTAEKVSDIDSWVSSCVICKQYPSDHACIPCGHMVLCNDGNCHRGCNKKCPTCRKDIISINRIYSDK